MLNNIRIILGDNHRLFHKFLTELFAESEIQLIATVTDSNEIQKLCQEHQPDVLLLAPNVTGATILDTLNYLRNSCPTTRVLAFLADYDETSVKILLGNGAAGCFLKSDMPENLVTAVREINRGEFYLSQSLLKKFILEQNVDAILSSLSERERAIMYLVASELSDKEISVQLNLSERTVRRHLEILHDKLNVKTRVGIALQAAKLKLIS
ncbi:MAG: DNA-binding response regulator [Ardenticatenaceae bacterium]|nr:MAG: DNA-binding response regulator [Ardenticatenaceae bacterium]